MESQNISLNRPVSPKQYSSTSQPNIKQYRKPQEDEAGFSTDRAKRASLELYGGTGKVRTEQPAVRGSNIDITV